MHNLSPTEASILGGQLFGVTLGNPFASLSHRCPPIDSHRTECFSQGAHYARCVPIYFSIGSNSVDKYVFERLRLQDF